METLSMPEILGEGIYDSSVLPKYRHGGVTPERITDCFELELPTEKCGVLYLGDTARPVTPSLVLVAKPGQRRHTLLPYRCHFIHLKCDGELLRLLNSLPDFISLSEPKAAQRLFGEFILYRAGTEQNRLLAYSRFFELISMLMNDGSRTSFIGVRSEAIVSALRYIDENLDGDLTLERLAEYCHLSPVYFHRLFKRHMGMTPYRYILDKKLTEAKKQLIMTNKSCLEIALGLGFSSQSYFNYSFRQETGLSPLQFRREHTGVYPDRG